MNSIHFEVTSNAIAIWRIDQQGSLVNVLTRELWSELASALDELKAQPGLRGLVISSAKPGVFVAGADLKLLANATRNDPEIRTYIEQGLAVLEGLENLPFPTCAVVDGVALGGGFELALACDRIVCGENPKLQLGLPEVNLGLIPGWGGTQRLMRMISPQLAVEMLTTGKSITGSNLHGLEPFVESIAPGRDPLAYACQLLHEERIPFGEIRRLKNEPLASREGIPDPQLEDSQALRTLLEVIRQGSSLKLLEGIRIETDSFMKLVGTEEVKSRIAAFFESRRK